VCPFYQKHNFQQFCPNQVCQLVLCEHVESSNHFNRLSVMFVRRASERNFTRGTKTDTGPLASGSLVGTCMAFWYSNQIINKAPTMLRFTNTVIVILATDLH